MVYQALDSLPTTFRLAIEAVEEDKLTSRVVLDLSIQSVDRKTSLALLRLFAEVFDGLPEYISEKLILRKCELLMIQSNREKREKRRKRRLEKKEEIKEEEGEEEVGDPEPWRRKVYVAKDNVWLAWCADRFDSEEKKQEFWKIKDILKNEHGIDVHEF